MRTAFVRRSVKKFMPGETASDAIAAAVALKPSGISTILTHLGENIANLGEADEVERILEVAVFARPSQGQADV